MPTLYFKVGADYENVVRLREEITKLENQLKSFGKSAAETQVRQVEERLAQTRQEFTRITTEAVKAGASVEGGFKKRIFEASQTVSALTERIIEQRSTVKKTEYDVRRLGEAYRASLKSNPIAASMKKAEYDAARKALEEDRAALFGLTQQQAEARLSVKRLRDEYSLYKKDAGEVTVKNEGLSLSWGRMLGVLGGAAALKQLGAEIIRVRGEFQAADTAIRTLLGSKEKADELMEQVREYAKISPLEFSDVTAATQMMLGFNIEAEKVPRYLKAIGDVSMGDTQRFNSLTLAFSQMSAAGKLMGQDLNQMINAGFNPLQQISEKTGKSIAELKDEMSKGAVSAEMVQQAFIDATSAGGRFYQMSENASKTISGQISMMHDAMTSAFNEIGQSSDGVLMEGIKMTTSLIENYDTIGRVLAGLLATYGAYRTALILNITLTRSWAVAARADAVAKGIQTAATKALTIAQAALNSVMKANPFVAVTTAVVALAAAVWTLSSRTSETEKATARLNEILDEHSRKEEEHKQKVDSLIASIEDSTKAEGERIAAFEALKAEYPSIFEKYLTEAEYLKEIVKYKRMIAEEDARRSTSDLQAQLRLEQSKLNRWTDVRRNGTSTSLVDMDGNGWATDNVEDAIREQTAIVNRLKAEIAEPIVSSYLSGIKSMDDASIKDAIDDITLSIRALGSAGKDSIAVVSTLGGEFSKGQLETIRSALETERKSRSGGPSYGEDYAKAKKEWEEAKRELSKIEADKDKYSRKQYDEAVKREETARKAYQTLGGSTSSSSGSKAVSGAEKEAEKQKQLQQKLGDELLKLREDNQDADIALMEEGTEKKLRQIEAVYSRQKDAIAKQESEWAKANREAGVTGLNEGGLTQEQQTAIDEARRLNELSRKQAVEGVKEEEAEKLKAHQEAWNEYYKRFGDYQQKRQAIAASYAEKIAEAEKEGDSGKAASLTREMENELDGLDNAVKGSATLMGQLFADASRMSVSEIQKIIDKAEQLLAYLGAAKDEEGTADIGGEKVSRQSILDLGISETSLRNLELSADEVESLRQAIDRLKGGLAGRSPFKKFEKEVEDAFAKFRNGDIAGGISDIGKAVAEFSPALSQFGDSLGTIFGSDGLGSAVSGISDALGGLGQTASGVGQIMSGDIVGGAMSAVNGIASVVSALDGLFGADYSEYEEMKGRYDTLVSLWDELIGRKTEYISIDYGTEAMKAAEEAARLTEMNIVRQRELAEKLAESGSSIGSHSLGYRVDVRMEESDWRAVSDLVGQKVSSLGDVLALDADIIGGVLQNERFVTVLSEVNSEFIDYIQSISDYADRLDEIAEKEKEAFTGVSFDEFRDGFVDLLSDLSTENEDFAEDFEDALRNAVFSALVANQYKARIQALYDQWSDYSKSDGELTSDEAAKMREEYSAIVHDMMADRQSIMDAMGWSTEAQQQSASSGGFQSMSQDTGDELNGRFTAMYECDLRREALQQGIYDVAAESRTLIAQSYLELQQISENTGAVIAPIRKIQEGIEQIKQNTSRL